MSRANRSWRSWSMTMALACGSALSMQAAHYAGGDISYQCLGGNNYLVTLDLFRDCSGFMIVPQDLHFQSSCGQSFDVLGIPAPPGTEVSQLCTALLPSSTCNGGALPGYMHYAL